MTRTVAHELTCKYCQAVFTIKCKPEDLDLYFKCCKPCWDDDQPGMARFERMQNAMGTRWAIDHA